MNLVYLFDLRHFFRLFLHTFRADTMIVQANACDFVTLGKLRCGVEAYVMYASTFNARKMCVRMSVEVVSGAKLINVNAQKASIIG